jgi:phosphopantetheine adenylyltransferase
MGLLAIPSPCIETEAETEAGGHAVNEKRRALQRRPVQLLVVPLVQSNQGAASPRS